MTVKVAELLERLGIKASRKGREWWACCPSHDERTPSWRMRDEPGGDKHGFHQCFGCGFNGGPIAIVRHVLECSPIEARAFLSGASVERIELDVRVRIDRARRAFTLPGEAIFDKPLDKWPSAARIYLERRGFDAETVARWGIGFAADGVLAGRIVIPIFDAKGRPTSFAARTFIGDERRYREAQASDGSDRSTVLGEHLWPDLSERAARDVVVVEGPFDALAADVAGYPVGGVRGSNPSTDQLLSLSTWGGAVVVTDPDAAGDKAHDALVGALARHVARVRRVRPSGGIDLAEHLQRGGVDTVREIIGGST